MDRFVISGGRVLQGEVAISGAKNAVLPILAASLLSRGTCVLKNVPRLKDVVVMLQLLSGLGAKISFKENKVSINCSSISLVSINPEIVKKMRASNLVLGPILARFKEAELITPGGCSIGSRPMDLHLRAIEKMGALIVQSCDGIFAFTKGLTGTNIQLDFPSVGATENIIMAAALAEGETVITNSAREPEIIDLANFINAMGGKVKGAGTDKIVIQGVERLGGCEYEVMSDRIESGTMMIAAAITRGSLLLQGVSTAYNDALINNLHLAGVEIVQDQHGIWVRGDKPGRVKSVNCVTKPYPCFPTDMQPQFMALMTLAEGESVIQETVFENRLKHVEYLNKMGASIKVQDNIATITGVTRLSGSRVSATDLRAGAALVLAGLAAEGNTVIDNIHYIDRGYEQIECKLAQVGACMCRKADRKPDSDYQSTAKDGNQKYNYQKNLKQVAII